MRIELLLDAFHEDGGVGAAAPDDVRREAFELAGEDDEAAAASDRRRPQLADEDACSRRLPRTWRSGRR